MGTGVGEAMLISAATGGGMAAVTGGDPLKGALLGAVTGGVGHGIAGATAAGGANAATILPSTGAEAASANLATSGGGALPGLSGPATGNLSSVAGVQPSAPASLAPGLLKPQWQMLVTQCSPKLLRCLNQAISIQVLAPWVQL
jgi:hypothetical protein